MIRFDTLCGDPQETLVPCLKKFDKLLKIKHKMTKLNMIFNEYSDKRRYIRNYKS